MLIFLNLWLIVIGGAACYLTRDEYTDDQIKGDNFPLGVYVMTAFVFWVIFGLIPCALLKWLFV